AVVAESPMSRAGPTTNASRPPAAESTGDHTKRPARTQTAQRALSGAARKSTARRNWYTQPLLSRRRCARRTGRRSPADQHAVGARGGGIDGLAGALRFGEDPA